MKNSGRFSHEPVHIIRLLGIATLLAVMPHILRVPIWISTVHILLVLARMSPFVWQPLARQKNGILLHWTIIIAALCSCAGIYATYYSLAGLETGVALLVVLAAFKFSECKNDRDIYISCWLGYFLGITHFLYSQTIPTMLYMCVILILITTILVGYNDKHQNKVMLRHLRLATGMLLRALPIMVILFVLFPRLNGPLWGLPEDGKNNATTGIDNVMEPGTISQLSLSDEIVFRVSFDGTIPKPENLYWRGPVLEKTDGNKWTEINYSIKPRTMEYLGKPVKYEMIIEPTYAHWLFALEMPEKLPPSSYLTRNHQLKTRHSIQNKNRYSIVSYNEFRFEKIGRFEKKYNLAIPDRKHPKTKELVSQWKQQNSTPDNMIKTALDYLATGEFVYTLEPKLLYGDKVDNLLFNTREGFCEHYASAFVTMMRIAGIPARVVAGYQGGEINPIGDYLMVKQYHAHAWSEVWLDGRGWTRIDPTSVVSPARINDGPSNINLDIGLPNSFGLAKSELAFRLWLRLRNQWDSINYQWSQWMLGYGTKNQGKLFKKLGLGEPDWEILIAVMTILVTILVAFLAFGLRKKTTQKSPEVILYQKYCQQLTHLNINKISYEGPYDFAGRVISVRRDLKHAIQTITDLYMDIHYGEQTYKLSGLETAVLNFKPKN